MAERAESSQRNKHVHFLCLELHGFCITWIQPAKTQTQTKQRQKKRKGRNDGLRDQGEVLPLPNSTLSVASLFVLFLFLKKSQGYVS